MSKSASEAALDRLIAPLLLRFDTSANFSMDKGEPDSPGCAAQPSCGDRGRRAARGDPETTAGDHLVGAMVPFRLESNAQMPRIGHPPVSVPVTSRLPSDADHEHPRRPCERPHDTIAQF
jgi:hypothetical protein